MCQRVTCQTCGKPTYQGCGLHVEQVLSGVPQAQRCSCAPGDARTVASAGTGAAGGTGGGLFTRLFGGRRR